MAVDQDLINPALRTVMDQVPQRMTDAVDWRLAKLVERSRGVPPQLSYALLRSSHEPERRLIDAVWSRIITDQVFVLALPTETLRVGRDIPARHRQWPYFPPQLRDLYAEDGPGDVQTATNAEIRSTETSETRRALTEVTRDVESLDRTAGSGRGSAARIGAAGTSG